MRAAAIFFFARVMRAAIVDSGTRNARAISAVLRPQTSRKVSATWASRDRAGWQQVQISRNRSSGICASATTASSADVLTASSTSNGMDRRNAVCRRSWSSARRRATVVNHAPGRDGTPLSAQLVSACVNAS
jgi:hypothetical protein